MRFAVDREQIFVPGIRPPHPTVERHPKRVQCLGFERVGFQGCEDRYPVHRHQPRHRSDLFLSNWDMKYSFGGTIPCKEVVSKTQRYPPLSMFFRLQVDHFNDIRINHC